MCEVRIGMEGGTGREKDEKFYSGWLTRERNWVQVHWVKDYVIRLSNGEDEVGGGGSELDI